MHQSSAFTLEQCQQLLALLSACNSSPAIITPTSEAPMANVASSSNNANVAMAGTDFSQSVFAAHVVIGELIVLLLGYWILVH